MSRQSIALAVGLAALVSAAEARVKRGEHPSPPTSEYTIKDIDGWSIYVQKPLLGEEKVLGDEALRVLEDHLFRITRAVPEPAVAELRRVRIWLHHKGRGNVAQYHPSKGWLKANDFNTDLARCVDLGDARNFLRSTRWQPMVVLHELAHAYHDQVWGWNDRDVVDAYEGAVESKSYDKVLIHNGRHGRAYAMTNCKEYFAETSEAFFGANDIYPFVRAELREHDPVMFKVLEKIWAGPPEKQSNGSADQPRKSK
jgi:hypothetical protein